MASIIKADTLQSTTSNVFVLNSAGTEYARFDSSGVFQLANPTTFPAGTAALPSITATGDTNTGLYFPAADTIAFSEGGAEAMRIDSSGNVGIGTASPAVKLHVSGGTQRIQSTGSTSNAFLTLQNDVGTQAILGIVSSGNNPANHFYIETNAGKTVYVDSSGNLLVGTTTLPSSGGTTGFGVEVNASRGQISLRSSVTSSSFIQAFYNTNGLVGSIQTSGSATSYVTSSDYRLKEDIVPMTGALAKVQALKPTTYKWKVDGSDGQGFIAHELAEVVPDCVSGEKDEIDSDGNPVYQGIDTSFLVATLTAAIQEQQALITQLQADVAALKAK